MIYESLTTIARQRPPGGTLVLSDDAALELASEMADQGMASAVDIYQGILEGDAKFMGHTLTVAD
jgi:hypothetical protein